jgi:hypothetical protein
MAKLQKLQQGANTPVSHHLATFNNLASFAKITQYEVKRDYLVRSLNESLLQAIFNNGGFNAYDWGELVDNLLTAENNLNTLKALQGRRRFHQNNFQRNNNNFRPRYTPPSRDPNAMDVDVVRLGKLSNEEREDLRKKNACFRCRKQGHMSRNCPLNQAPARSSRIEELPDENINACRVNSDF